MRSADGQGPATSVAQRVSTGGPGFRTIGRAFAFNEVGVLIALVVLVVVIGVAHPNFFSVASLVNVAQGAAPYGIMALGMVFLLSMREIDLSVGAIYAVSIMVAALLMSDAGWNPWLAVAAGLVVAAGLGAFNAIAANTLGIATLIVTLGTLTMYRGITLVLSGNGYVSGLPRDHAFFRIFGGEAFSVPASVWAFAALAIVLTFVYRSTRFAFVVRAIGSNEQAARLSGIPIERIRLILLAAMGLLCGIAGMLTLGYFQSADPNLGFGYELLVIAAAVIGGTGLAGGSGSVPGALIGALLISAITSGLLQFGVDANWNSFVTGAVILAAVAVDAVIRKRRARRVALVSKA